MIKSTTKQQQKHKLTWPSPPTHLSYNTFYLAGNKIHIMVWSSILSQLRAYDSVLRSSQYSCRLLLDVVPLQLLCGGWLMPKKDPSLYFTKLGWWHAGSPQFSDAIVDGYRNTPLTCHPYWYKISISVLHTPDPPRGRQCTYPSWLGFSIPSESTSPGHYQLRRDVDIKGWHTIGSSSF